MNPPESKYLSRDNPIPREEFGTLPKEVIGDRRKTADEETRRDLSKRYEQLLSDAHEEITDPNRTPDQNLGFSNRRLGGIFARSAMAMDKSAEENVKLQKDILDLTKHIKTLTYVVIGVAILQLLVALYPIFKPSLNTSNSNGTTNQNTNTNQIRK